MNRAPTRTTQWKFTSFIPSNEASSPSSVSWSPSKETNTMVLLASMAAARACQRRRRLHRKLTEAEGYPKAISYDQSFGLLKACYNSYFHAYLLRGSKLITTTNCGTTEILMVLQTHPCCSHQALTPSSPIGLRWRRRRWMVVLTRKASARTWKRCKQSVKRMTRGKIETKDLLEGILVIGSGWSI